MDTKQKYIRLKNYNSFVFFPAYVDHDEFQHFKIISAGFCYFHNHKVHCFGESIGLGLKSKEEDSELATKQIFGDE